MPRARATQPRARKGTSSNGAGNGTTTATGIFAWEDDPGAPATPNNPLPRPAPTLDSAPLPVGIRGSTPAAKTYRVGSKNFRYWTAAEALRRGADLWGSVLPPGVTWHSTVGRKLQAGLDQGEDFNAFYDRAGLQFFHGSTAGQTVFSGESPDVVCHELGHAVLDALRPQLWDAASVEVAAFHESFGDMSAILSTLQLQTMRETVLVDTGGKLYRSSRLSRLAEQLGWAIRQVAPDAVDPDCLRNAVNSLFYEDPAQLPPSAPASSLSSEPHSLSRVFTASFFDALAGMFSVSGGSDQASLLAVSLDAANLLVDSIVASPVVPGYFSQIAAHMLEADSNSFGGRYADALKGAFARHGVLSLEAAVATGLPASSQPHARMTGTARRRGTEDQLPRVTLPPAAYGLSDALIVHAAGQPARFLVAGAAADIGSSGLQAHEHAAASFVEDLFRRGRVEVSASARSGAVVHPFTRKTHRLDKEADGLVLRRNFFDCGLDCLS